MSTPPRSSATHPANGRGVAPACGHCRLLSRVLFVAGELSDESVGHSVLRLACELRRRGKEVGLLCGGGDLMNEFEGIGISPYVSRHLRSPGGRLWMPERVAACVREFGPELVHLFGHRLAAWGWKLSQATGLPYILTVMTFASSGRGGQIPGDWGRGCVLTVSEELREDLVNRVRIPKEAISVIPIGIALEDYERYCESDGSNRIPIVGTVGPLTPDCGCEYFLRAAREILDKGYEAQFLVAGDGPERLRLRRLIRELDIEARVTMVHQFADYREMIAVLDVCVIPALQAGLSLNVIEAMACRKPVVAAGVGAVYHVVRDGETGLLAPKKDPAAIAAKVIRLLDDREGARRIVEAAYQFVREAYSIQATVGKLLGLYARCQARMESG